MGPDPVDRPAPALAVRETAAPAVRRGSPSAERLLVAIPTFNEAPNIVSLLPALLDLYPAAHVVVIDDASPDGTGDIVAGLASADPRIHLIRRPGKLGLGSAYRAAFAWALERSHQLVAVMDADFSHEPEQLALLLQAVTSADVVVGSRYVPDGGVSRWPLHRRALSRTANLVARVLVGTAIHDWTSGFKVYRREVLRSLRSGAITSEGYAFQVEILFHCLRNGFRVHEVPITFVDRRLGETKMSRREVTESVQTLLRLAWRRLTPGS